MTDRPSTVTALDLEECAREPIHVPGAIQPHGVLLALEPESLEIVQASANAADLLGVAHGDLIGSKVLDHATSPAHREALARWLLEADAGFTNPFRVPVRLREREITCDAVAHRRDGVVIFELENPSSLPTDDPALGAVDHYFMLVQRTLAEIHGVDSPREVCERLVEQVRAFTGFDRVMAYRFAADDHGEVIAEARAEALEPYLGLHYPATDIPEQARRLYVLNPVRIIVDVGYQPVPILPAENPHTGAPLDLSFSVLRSVSPVHVEYLRNMGVGASMSVSLLDGDRLWGLIACHHRTPRFVSYGIRAACAMFSLVMSSQLTARERSARHGRRSDMRGLHARLLEAIAERRGVAQTLGDKADTLLRLVEASGGVLALGGELTLFGETPSENEVKGLVSWFCEKNATDVLVYESLVQHFPPAAGYRDVASGLLALPLGLDDCLLFFRPEARRTIHWAGDPAKPALAPGAETDGETPRLSPRLSFAAWAETVVGHCLPWDDALIESARTFRNALMVSILGQERELERLNHQLASKNKEMEQFVYTVSHDLKSPLVACKGFVGLMLQDLEKGDLEQARDSANEVEVATERMSQIIDDLLELSRIGRESDPPVEVDVEELIDGLRRRYAPMLEEAGVEVVVETALPPAVVHPRSFERALDNLITNAVKYGCDGDVKRIEIGARRRAREQRYYVRDHGSGIEERFQERIFGLFQRLDTSKPGTGLGLASVAKTMEVHGGRVWVDSVPGKGSTFWLALPRR